MIRQRGKRCVGGAHKGRGSSPPSAGGSLLLTLLPAAAEREGGCALGHLRKKISGRLSWGFPSRPFSLSAAEVPQLSPAAALPPLPACSQLPKESLALWHPFTGGWGQGQLDTELVPVPSVPASVPLPAESWLTAPWPGCIPRLAGIQLPSVPEDKGHFLAYGVVCPKSCGRDLASSCQPLPSRGFLLSSFPVHSNR